MLANAKHGLATATRKDANDADGKLLAQLTQRAKAFEAAMDDDLNTPVAVSVLFETVGDINKHFADPHAATLTSALATFRKMADVVDILPAPGEGETAAAAPPLPLPPHVRPRARPPPGSAPPQRTPRRLLELGYVIEDGATGPRWRRKN